MKFSVSVYVLVSVLTIAFFSACGMVKNGGQPVASGPAERTPHEPESEEDTSVSSLNQIREQLRSAHSEWKGTPYVLGGNSRNGIDCSAFTRIVFREFFGRQLPRHTSRQLQTGSGIRRNHIRPGDLIFFRTAKGVLHVGIAMDDGDFLHASVSSGVMISNIREHYWATRYLGARRVL